MESIKEIFKIGKGPSSSHTMGPNKAALLFKTIFPDSDKIEVTLYGSLAATGRGHLTDIAIFEGFAPKETVIDWQPSVFLPFHPNAMKFVAFKKGLKIGEKIYFSIGGGSIIEENQEFETQKVYQHTRMSDILSWCDKQGITFWEYVGIHESNDIWESLTNIWNEMKQTVIRGLENEGVLPGILKLPRKAASFYSKARSFKDDLQKKSLVYAYALAVSEENASGGRVVTAPTCGACGVLPAVLYALQQFNQLSDKKIVRALATAGLIGNLVKYNASISGADVGCQGEVGTACAMASAAATQLIGGTNFQIEYAAETGMEHHLGLTCDPLFGLVQIPCIERNAFGAARALDCSTFAIMGDGKHRISFDRVVDTMKRTGHDLPKIYKETSEGGLALWDNEVE